MFIPSIIITENTTFAPNVARETSCSTHDFAIVRYYCELYSFLLSRDVGKRLWTMGSKDEAGTGIFVIVWSGERYDKPRIIRPIPARSITTGTSFGLTRATALPREAP